MKLVTLTGALAVASLAPALSTVVPNGFENTPGGGGFLGPFSTAQRTYQLLIHENQLSAHVGRQINGFTFRILPSATAAWPASSITFSNFDVRLSGSVAPADRSLTFADNVVGAQTLVRAGELTIGAASFPAGGSPNAFGPMIGLQNLYNYTGGHLLIEIRHTGFSGTSQSVDAVAASGGPGNGYGVNFSAAWTGNYAGVSGSQGNFAVTQISSVPEPGTMAAICLGLAGVMARRRRKSA
jgi:hypothetical protein